MMEGYPQKLPNEMHSYGYGNTVQQQHYGSLPTALVQNVVDTLTPVQSYVNQTHSTSAQVENSSGGIMPTPGTSLQEDFGEEVIVPQSGGRKKKKKHKSGENIPGSSVKPEVMDEEGLVDAAIPLLSENQGVEDLLFSGSLPSSGGTIVGGQYLLNNSLLDQILTEKKLQLLHSPEVMEWLKKHMEDK